MDATKSIQIGVASADVIIMWILNFIQSIAKGIVAAVLIAVVVYAISWCVEEVKDRLRKSKQRKENDTK